MINLDTLFHIVIVGIVGQDGVLEIGWLDSYNGVRRFLGDMC